MAPIPIETGHVLKLGYVTQTLTHHQEVYCEAVPSGDTTGFDLSGFSAGTVPLTDAIDQWQAIVGPLLGLGTVAAGVTLYSVVDGALIPVYAGSYSFDAVGADNFSCTQSTWFFRDFSNRACKLVTLEGEYSAPFKTTDPLATPLGAIGRLYVADLTNPATGKLGFWTRSRSGDRPRRFVSQVTSLNRRIRRRRGVA